MTHAPDLQFLEDEPLQTDLSRHLNVTLGRDNSTSHRYLYNALALTVRDRLVKSWRKTRDKHHLENPKRVHYLSLEFLMGRTLTNAISKPGSGGTDPGRPEGIWLYA